MNAEHLVDITKNKSGTVGWFRDVQSMAAYAMPQIVNQAARADFWERFCHGNVVSCAQYVADGPTPEQLQPVRETLDRLTVQIDDRTKREYVASPVGAFPVVPDVLAGRPMPMRRHAHVEHETAPLRVFIDVSTSSSVDHTQIATRGAAVVALLMRLAETHPLQVFAVAANKVGRKNIGVAMRVDTMPIDVAHLTALFTMPQFTRGIRLPAMAQMARASINDERFPWAFCSKVYAVRERGMREMFDISPDDVYIAGASQHWIHTVTRNPTAWVNNRIKEQQKAYREADKRY